MPGQNDEKKNDMDEKKDSKNPPNAPEEPSTWKKFLPYFFAILAIISYAVSFFSTSKFIGDKEIWISLQPQINTILISCMVGTGLLMIGAFLYFLQDQTYMMYFLLFLTFITLCLSYASLSIAAISSK